MSFYLTREMATFALAKMQNFYYELESLYTKHGLNINEDMGRRNILMSSLQEKYFAKAIGGVFPDTSANGKTGEPDIIIPALNRELECKLTSKNRSGSWALQSDYNTLSRKGAVDHLYVLASDDFGDFGVLFFEGLTTGDFHPPASGSKGKSRLNWAIAIHKCTVVMGGINDKSEKYVTDATSTLNAAKTSMIRQKAQARIDYWKSRTNISLSLERI
jgi:hypothetical protein